MIIETVFSVFVICSDPACVDKVIGDEGRAVIREAVKKEKSKKEKRKKQKSKKEENNKEESKDKKDLIKKLQDIGVNK